MATNQLRYVGNIYGAPGPYRHRVKMQAGATQELRHGEICKLSAGNFVPLAADEAMAAVVAIADLELLPGDLAGFRSFIIPRPGDLFEGDLDAAAAPAQGADLFIASSTSLTTAGANVFGNVCDESLLPPQGFQSRSPSFDAGTTVRTTSRVRFTIKQSVSYLAALQK